MERRTWGGNIVPPGGSFVVGGLVRWRAAHLIYRLAISSAAAHIRSRITGFLAALGVLEREAKLFRFFLVSLFFFR